MKRSFTCAFGKSLPFIISFCSIFLFVSSASCLAFQNLRECDVFYEKDGIVMMEVEAAPVNEDWKLKTAHSGYSGSGYYEWTGPDHFYAGGYGTLKYEFIIQTPGRYQLRIRSFNPSNDHTEHNDVWIRFPGKETILANGHRERPNDWVKLFHYITKQWTWLSLAEGGYDIFVEFAHPGRYSFEMSGRSEGFAVDRIALQKVGAQDVEHSNLPQSAIRKCNPNNNAPQLVNWIPYQRFPYGRPFDYTLFIETFVDPDGDPLTYEAVLEDYRPVPSWLQLNSQTRNFSGNPQLSDVGSYRIRVRALDPDGRVAEFVFSLSIYNPEVNSAPIVIHPVNVRSAAIYLPFEMVEDNVFADPDGDDLVYSASMADGSPLPEWISFNAATKTFSGMAKPENQGEHHIKLTATDPEGLSEQDHFILYVIDQGYDEPVGIRNKNFAANIKVFPNPFNNLVVIDFGDRPINKARVIVNDLTGKVVKEFQSEIMMGKAEILLNDKDVKPGIYALRVFINEKEVHSIKIIKQ
jgi:hypothetical protein